MTVSEAVRKTLWGQARNQCAFPGCTQLLVEPGSPAAVDIPVVVGEEAHIRSPRSGGPRFDPDYDPAKLNSHANLILLCPTHHTMIDKNGGAGYTVDQLVKMRQSHERDQAVAHRVGLTIRAYMADQYEADDRILFEAVDLHGPTVESMFVDVPFTAQAHSNNGPLMAQLQRDHPGDINALSLLDGNVVTGAAQALLHPEWSGNALLVGGPGQGKSTLLQFVCQFHRSRRLGTPQYSGTHQALAPLTEEARVPIRIDLRRYAEWPGDPSSKKRKGHGRPGSRGGASATESPSRSLESYLVREISSHSGGAAFDHEELLALIAGTPTLLALDGLDEVANVDERDRVAKAIVETTVRLQTVAADLVVLVATRPGATTSAVWNSAHFPEHHLQPLTPGLRLQYLERWLAQSQLPQERADKLRATYVNHAELPHIQELASNPMQLAILMHLLYRRGLLPQQRTELYREYVKTFLDREGDGKEPLVDSARDVVEDIHAFLAWHLQARAELGESSGSLARDTLKRLVRDYLEDRPDGQVLADSLFAAITSRVICLVERKKDTFEFEVQSLREYFAALHIYENVPPSGTAATRDGAINTLIERPYWHNVLRFLVGMLSKGERRSLDDNARTVAETQDLDVLPQYRYVIAQLLDDRVFQDLTDANIRTFVDLLLAGPGVTFAQDGLLTTSGAPLALQDGSGRTQAREHLQEALLGQPDKAMIGVLTAALLKHDEQPEVHRWWWSSSDTKTEAWIYIAAGLQAMSSLTHEQEQQLAAASSRCHWSPSQPAEESLTALLLAGGYAGKADQLLAPCLTEIKDGVTELLRPLRPQQSQTPLGRLVAAVTAPLGYRGLTRGDPDATQTATLSQPRARRRSVVGETERETLRPLETLWGGDPDTTARATLDRASVASMHHILGDCWIVRCTIASMPPSALTSSTSTPAISDRASTAELSYWSQLARERGFDLDWWLVEAPQTGGLAARTWLLHALAFAGSDVVQALAPEMNRQLGALSAAHVDLLEQAVSRLRGHGLGRLVSMREAVRLGTVAFSDRLAFLLRRCSHEQTGVELGKILLRAAPAVSEMTPGMRRELGTIAAASHKALRLQSIGPAEREQPPYASSDAPAITIAQARRILSEPHMWPQPAVTASIQKLSLRTMKTMPPLATVALEQAWFQNGD